MNIERVNDSNRSEVLSFFKQSWGTDDMVISSGTYACATLEGFLCRKDAKEVVGLVTYINKEDICEVISLDSGLESHGIGTALIEAVEAQAKENRCASIQLVTTNDNLQALRFYQKRGFRLTAILPDAVDRARKQKAEIPLIGHDGIPLLDEIALSKQLYYGGSDETEQI